jgi:hypothetical protein
MKTFIADDDRVLVLVRREGGKMAVPLSQLTGLDAGESTAAAIADWYY